MVMQNTENNYCEPVGTNQEVEFVVPDENPYS